jgi:transposase-like protein
MMDFYAPTAFITLRHPEIFRRFAPNFEAKRPRWRMSNYGDRFKRDAMQQIMVRCYPVRDVARRLEVSSHAFCKGMRVFGRPAVDQGGREPTADAGAGAADRGT